MSNKNKILENFLTRVMVIIIYFPSFSSMNYKNGHESKIALLICGSSFFVNYNIIVWIWRTTQNQEGHFVKEIYLYKVYTRIVWA